MIKSASDEIRRAIAMAIKNNFDPTKVNGLLTIPTVTQNPTRQTQEPYIYVYSVAENEIDVTKEDGATEYTVNVEVCIRYNQRRGGQRQANQILDEVTNHVRGFALSEYPQAIGYTIYRTTFGNVSYLDFKENGANYYKVICPFFVSAYPTPIPAQTLPVQAPTFGYAGFSNEPSAFKIERYDAGTITPNTTYPDGNNGWNFADANFSVSAGAAGTYDGSVYTLGAGQEPVKLDSSLRYTLDSDSTETTTLSATTEWNLIDSIRYGAVNADGGAQPSFVDDASATYGLRLLSNWNVEFGTTSPHNELVTITGDSGQYVYIIVDHEETLTQITNNGINTISLWDVETVGNYKVYINTQPIVFNDFSIDYNLIA